VRKVVFALLVIIASILSVYLFLYPKTNSGGPKGKAVAETPKNSDNYKASPIVLSGTQQEREVTKNKVSHEKFSSELADAKTSYAQAGEISRGFLMKGFDSAVAQDILSKGLRGNSIEELAALPLMFDICYRFLLPEFKHTKGAKYSQHIIETCKQLDFSQYTATDLLDEIERRALVGNMAARYVYLSSLRNLAGSAGVYPGKIGLNWEARMYRAIAWQDFFAQNGDFKAARTLAILFFKSSFVDQDLDKADYYANLALDVDPENFGIGMLKEGIAGERPE